MTKKNRQAARDLIRGAGEKGGTARARAYFDAGREWEREAARLDAADHTLAAEDRATRAEHRARQAENVLLSWSVFPETQLSDDAAGILTDLRTALTKESTR